MRISEAHTKLDKRCVIAIRQHSGIFGVLARIGERLPTYTFTEEDKTYIQVFLPKKEKPSPSMAPILSRKDIVEKRSYYSITERINNVEGMKVISKLLEAPSVALNDSYMLKDELYMDFRFHSAKLDEIDDILMGVIGKNENFRIVKMTQSRKIRERMEEMHLQTPLAVVRYSMPIPMDNELVAYIEKEHPGAVAEIEGRTVSEQGIKILLYTEKSVDFENVSAISRDNNVYETSIIEKALMEGRRMGNEARIPRIAFFLTIENGRLFDTTFVPAAEADEYVGVMMASMKLEDGVRPRLEYYSLLDDKVWEWI